MKPDWWRFIRVGLCLLTVGSFTGGGLARAEDKPKALIGIAEDQSKSFTAPPTDILLSEPTLLHGATLQAAGKFWIGVMCEPAGEALHAQLPDLPKDHGLVVQQVVPESPAAKAGIQAHDILVSAGDKSLAQVSDLSGAIEAGKGAELSIKLLRGGKMMTIAVKPEEHKPLGEQLNVSPGKDDETLRLFLNRLQPEGNGSQSLDLRTFRVGPSTMLPWAIGAKHELPDDLSVDIFREGKKPAKITVKKGNQKWEVTEDEFAKLPDDIRQHVEPLLSGGQARIDLNLGGDQRLSGLSYPPLGVLNLTDAQVAGNGAAADIEGRLEKNLDEMSQRLEAMRATVRELRAERQHHDTPNSEKKNEKPQQ